MNLKGTKKKKKSREKPRKVLIGKDGHLVQKTILVVILLLQENILPLQGEGKPLGLRLSPAAISVLSLHLADLLHRQLSIVLLYLQDITLLHLSQDPLFKDTPLPHVTKELLPPLTKGQLPRLWADLPLLIPTALHLHLSKNKPLQDIVHLSEKEVGMIVNGFLSHMIDAMKGGMTQERKGGERGTPEMIETMIKNRAPPEIIEMIENLVMGGIEGRTERTETAGI